MLSLGFCNCLFKMLYLFFIIVFLNVVFRFCNCLSSMLTLGMCKCLSNMMSLDFCNCISDPQYFLCLFV